MVSQVDSINRGYLFTCFEKGKNALQTVVSGTFQAATHPLVVGLAAHNITLSYFSGMSLRRSILSGSAALGLGILALLIDVKARSLLTTKLNSEKEQELGSNETTGQVKSITFDRFKHEVLESKQPVVVDAFASWCPPCKRVAPTFAALSVEFNGKVQFFKFDVDEEPDLTKDLGIEMMPTFLFYKNGECVGRHMGSMNRDDFVSEFVTHFL